MYAVLPLKPRRAELISLLVVTQPPHWQEYINTVLYTSYRT